MPMSVIKSVQKYVNQSFLQKAQKQVYWNNNV